MKRSRALIVSLGVAVAAVAGAYAATSTISLGSEAKASTDAQVAQRTAQLDRYEASLQATLAQKPPKLPSMPKVTTSSAGGPSATPARVVYRRAAPVVSQAAGSDDDYEHEDDDYEQVEDEYEHADDHGDGRESDD
ncbi:MAG: hypothetical protein ACXWZP_05635 [Gaiellaceae bacterium]